MKKLFFAAAAVMMLGAVGCGGVSSDTLCHDSCNQSNACTKSALGDNAPAATDCDAQCKALDDADTGDNDNACKNIGAYDDCINGVDTSKGDTCGADLLACLSHCND